MTRFPDEHGDIVEVVAHGDGTFEIAILEPPERASSEPSYRDGVILDVEAASKLYRLLGEFLAPFPQARADA